MGKEVWENVKQGETKRTNASSGGEGVPHFRSSATTCKNTVNLVGNATRLLHVCACSSKSENCESVVFEARPARSNRLRHQLTGGLQPGGDRRRSLSPPRSDAPGSCHPPGSHLHAAGLEDGDRVGTSDTEHLTTMWQQRRRWLEPMGAGVASPPA